MRHILYIIATILLIAWAIGFFVFNAGFLFHILLILSVIAIIIKENIRKKPVYKKILFKAQFVDHYSQSADCYSQLINHNSQFTNLK